MSKEYVYIPYVWRRQLAIIRLLLGAICLAAQAYYPMYVVPVVPALMLLYSAWALGVLLSDTLEQINYRFPALGIDFLLFITMTLNPAPELYWLNHIVYFYLLINSTLLFDFAHVAALSFGCIAFVLVQRPPHYLDLAPIVLLAGTLSVILALLKRQMQERISSAYKRAVMARAEAEMSRVDERERIAQDFHDGPLQCFISFKMRLELIRRLMEKDRAAASEQVQKLWDICDGQVTELRLFVRSMRPPEWSGDNASAGFRDILKTFHNDTGIQVTYSADESLTVEDEGVFTELLQVFREALHNIQKHAQASRAAVTLQKSKGRVVLRVEDDGSGFPFAGVFHLEELDALRMGPNSIKRRVRALGGELTVQSRPGEGATLRIEVPV